jgi:molybdopterin/thiamine biosynthesis adenylyltransferase
MRHRERLDRQLRIEDWDQRALDEAKLGVVGDDDLLGSVYLLSASALGVNNIVVIGPRLDGTLREMALKINPTLNLVHVEGYYTHPVLDDVFIGCDVIADVSSYALANKLLLEKGYQEGIPIVRGFCYQKDGEQGLKVFTYVRGREWHALEALISPNQLPADHFDDGVLDIIAAGILLEETTNVLMGRKTSAEAIAYQRRSVPPVRNDARVCVVGAGALGNFVGLGLAYTGFTTINFVDHDMVDVTNLNRQVFLYDAVGLSKAGTLAQRLKHMVGIDVRADVRSFDRETDISEYDVIFDCVDNFETKIVLSEKCREEKKLLISGGTGVDAGQVVVYHPSAAGKTPAELLGLSDIVAGRETDRREGEAACAHQPDPSVIMTNQVIAGFMVDACRMVLAGQEPVSIFYDSTSDKRI